MIALQSSRCCLQATHGMDSSQQPEPAPATSGAISGSPAPQQQQYYTRHPPRHYQTLHLRQALQAPSSTNLWTSSSGASAAAAAAWSCPRAWSYSAVAAAASNASTPMLAVFASNTARICQRHVCDSSTQRRPEALNPNGMPLRPALRRATKCQGPTDGEVKIGCQTSLHRRLSSECHCDINCAA